MSEKEMTQVREDSFSKTDSLALKGIAIILLVFYHCFIGKKVISKFQVNTFPLSRNAARELVSYFKICVPVFAFISGFGLFRSFENRGGANY